MLYLCLALKTFAQSEHGTHFEKNLSWNQVLQKAKSERKFIFVDCYATWCAPCKLMDRDVYPSDSVGAFMNSNFISVKMQIDSSKLDNAQIRSFYADVAQFKQVYSIKEFPTFLFFSPDGQLVHKGIGYSPTQAFIHLAKDALNPFNQYYSLIKEFRDGKLSYQAMPELINKANLINETKTSSELIRTYVNNYLLALDGKEIFTTENIGFLTSTAHTSSDPSFQLLYRNEALVDNLMKDKNFVQSIASRIIEKEEINNQLYKNKTKEQIKAEQPDWVVIHQNIEKKYSKQYADRIVLWAQMNWFRYLKDWIKYCDAIVQDVEKFGPFIPMFPYSNDISSAQSWNWCAWEIFSHSGSQRILNKALDWSEKAVIMEKAKNNETGYAADTKANILYRIGKTTKAIAEEENVLKTTGDTALKKTAKETLEKFRNKVPTWIN